jgi:hypothetical protein
MRLLSIAPALFAFGITFLPVLSEDEGSVDSLPASLAYILIGHYHTVINTTIKYLISMNTKFITELESRN